MWHQILEIQEDRGHWIAPLRVFQPEGELRYLFTACESMFLTFLSRQVVICDSEPRTSCNLPCFPAWASGKDTDSHWELSRPQAFSAVASHLSMWEIDEVHSFTDGIDWCKCSKNIVLENEYSASRTAFRTFPVFKQLARAMLFWSDRRLLNSRWFCILLNQGRNEGVYISSMTAVDIRPPSLPSLAPIPYNDSNLKRSQLAGQFESLLQLHCRFVEKSSEVYRSNLGCGSTVASFTAVIYDWGERTISKKLSIDLLMVFLALTFGQEVGRDHNHGSEHLTKNGVIGWTGLGEQSPISEEK